MDTRISGIHSRTRPVLVDRDGKDISLDVAIDGQAAEERTWRIPARAECMSCHARAVNYVLGLTELQMNRSHDYGAVRDNQLRTLEHIGLFSSPLPTPVDQRKQLPDPLDSTVDS